HSNRHWPLAAESESSRESRVCSSTCLPLHDRRSQWPSFGATHSPDLSRRYCIPRAPSSGQWPLCTLPFAHQGTTTVTLPPRLTSIITSTDHLSLVRPSITSNISKITSTLLVN